MQGYDFNFDIYASKWGTTGNKLNDFFKAIFSLNAGETAPATPLQGMPWLDISAGWNDAMLKFYDGNNWVLANEYSPYVKDLKLSTGSKSNLWERLDVSINPDGTLKSGLAENMTEWIDSGLTPIYIADDEFEIPGDQRDIFVQNRKIKATLDSENVYFEVESSNYDSFNEVTNVILSDSVINSSISKIEHGLIKPGATGSLPISEEQLVPSGGIIMWGGAIVDVPNGWALCDGNNGTPNLQDRFIVGAGNSYTVGDTGGSDSVAITETQLPAHGHSFSATTSNGGSHGHTGSTNTTGSHNHSVSIKDGTHYNIANSTLSGGATGNSTTDYVNHGGDHSHSVSIDSNGSHSHSISGTTSSIGNGESHENRPPYYALAYIMKL